MKTETYQQEGATVYRLHERLDNRGRFIKCNQYSFCMQVDIAGGGTQSDAEEEASRFKIAYNKTYHKGINPEAVPEMLEALKDARLEQYLPFELYKKLTEIIQKATL